MATTRSALRALRTPTMTTPLQRPFTTQTLTHLNRTIARSTLRTPATALRSALRAQTRHQTADATTTAEAPQSAFAKLWNSPVGPRTVHFWAPIMKWGLVIAGISDFFRPAEALSLQQNLALMATGAIWTRWCFIIKPRNVFLAAVNSFLFCVGSTQVVRVLVYRSQQDGKGVGQEVVGAAKEEAGVVKGVAEDPKGAVKKAERN